VHLLPEYRAYLDVSLPPEDDPKVLACCVLPENLPQFDFGEFPHHPLETITPKILNVDINHIGVEARQLLHLYLSIEQETFDSGSCGQRE
jgi:hypothetical protein